VSNPVHKYDALLIVSFGGPEKREDVIPFLENVLRGRNVPRERMLEVAEHYYHFDGRSPINDQNRALIDALRPALHGPLDASNFYVTHTELHEMLAHAWETAGNADSAAAHYAYVARAWSKADAPFAARAAAARNK